MTAPIDLNLVRAFVAVHDHGSFSGAAQQLSVPRSTVSRAVAGLERVLGTRLFQRTTRKVSTTVAGLALYDRMRSPLSALESSLAELPDQQEVPSGTLRVTTTVDLGAAVLAEATARYVLRYPGTSVDAHLSTDVVDLIGERFDLALRIAGKLPSSSLVAQRVGTITLGTYASPTYLARRGEPRTVLELKEQHNFIGPPHVATRIGKLVPRVTSNDFFFYREVAKAGAGVASLPSFLVAQDVAAGLLVQVLPKWKPPTGAVYIVAPTRKQTPRRVSAFQEVLREVLRQRPL